MTPVNNWTVAGPVARLTFMSVDPDSASMSNFTSELTRIAGVKNKGYWLVPLNAVAVVQQLLSRYPDIQIGAATWEKPPNKKMDWPEVEALLRQDNTLKDWVYDFYTEYQKEAVAFGFNKDGCHFWHPTGSGKTLSGISTALSLPGPIIVVTRAASRVQYGREINRFTKTSSYVIRPDSDFVGKVKVKGKSFKEFSNELKSYGVKKGMRKLWEEHIAQHGADPLPSLENYMAEMKELGLRPFIVVGWESLPDNLDRLVALQPGCVIYDECFVPSTLVETTNGSVPIDTIQPDDQVWSVDLTTGRKEIKKVVRVIQKPVQTTTRLVRVTHEYGTFVCTTNHKIWTEGEKYVEAENLVAGNYLCRMQEELLAEVSESDDACTGSTERRHFERSRVVSVTFLEQADYDGLDWGTERAQFVYDLEVADNHNYFADGILVSNCHRAKGFKRYETISLPDLPEDPEQASTMLRKDANDARAKGGFIKATDDGRRLFIPVKNVASSAALLARSAKKRLGTTATSVSNRVKDLWGQLDTIEPNAWGNATLWQDRYCDRHPGAYGGFDISGESNKEELKTRLDTVVHFLDYRETHKHLPAKRRQSYYVAPSDQVDESAGFSAALKEAYKRGPSSVLELKLMMAASRKRKAVLGLVEDHVQSGHKIVLFTGRRRDCDELGETIRKAQKNVTVWSAHGEHSDKLRQSMVDDYMAHPGPCVLISTGQAMGESINLQDTDAAMFVMLPYTPGQLRQWEGRFARLAQKRPVVIYYVIAEGTVDERVCSILIDKLPAVEKIGKDSELGEAAPILAGIDPNKTPEEFAQSILANIDERGLPEDDWSDWD